MAAVRMAAGRKPWITALVCATAATAAVGVTGCAAGAATGAPGHHAPAAAPDPRTGADADAIAEQAVQVTKEAIGLHVTGGPDEDLQDGLRIDVAADERGACAGTMDRQGTTADLIAADGALFLRAEEPFWRAAVAAGKHGADPAETEAMVGYLSLPGRWLKVADADLTRDLDLGTVCDLDTLRDRVDQDRSARTGLTRVDDASVNGRKAIVLKNRRLTLYVAKEGVPYLLRSVRTDDTTPATATPATTTYTFSDHGKSVVAGRPAEHDIVDLQRLDAGF
ncbi:hypothetical protein ACIRSU_15835 [Streptomyces sp. NPDC101160]|uniref:hypothetical protein n=1 Tax=Streptomyces sp. NPDC101160 TaxID=3366118 RepID=UPI00382553B7